MGKVPAHEVQHTRLRDLSAAYWWLWFAELVIWIGRFVVPFMTLFLTRDVGLSASAAGLVVSAYGLGVVVSAMVGGILADRLGRKRTLLGSLLLSAATVMLIPFAQEALLICILLFVYGLFNGAAQPVMVTMVGDMVEPRHRRTAYNYTFWAVNLGYAIGPLIAGFMADRTFVLVFFGQAALLLTATAIVAAKVPESHSAGRARRSPRRRMLRRRPPASNTAESIQSSPPVPRPGRGSIGRVLTDGVFMTFACVMLLYSIVYVQSMTTLPLVMADQGFSPVSYGYLLTLNGLLLCLLQIPTAKWLNRFSRDAVIVVAILVTGLGVGSQAAAATFLFYCAAVAVWTLGEMGSHPQAQSVAADLADHTQHGRYQGVYSLNHSIAMVVGPILGGAVLDGFGHEALWLGAGGVCVLAAVLLAVTGPARRRRLGQRYEEDRLRRYDAEAAL
ncbi:MFS transporter [Nesterenkonia sp. NBAIMH1]|uniref:MDR family MFS transporter n=1 Tax=Nesterenkonia sp. NBAIMH1 TaxID=2600320 RepID=UPI00143D5DD3|nr:MFS transporter [Nesterenkonia sp. NBAIMH1]